MFNNYRQLASFPVVIPSTVIDCSMSDTFTDTLTGNKTYTFSNFRSGQVVIVLVTNGTGAVPTFPGTVKWPASTAPTPSAAGQTDVYSFIAIGSNVYGNAVLNFP